MIGLLKSFLIIIICTIDMFGDVSLKLTLARIKKGK